MPEQGRGTKGVFIADDNSTEEKEETKKNRED